MTCHCIGTPFLFILLKLVTLKSGLVMPVSNPSLVEICQSIHAFIDGINLRLDAIWDEYKRDEVINLVSLFIYMKIFTCKRKNIPYLECLSTKTLWWTTLQLPYILMHRIREITW